METLITLTKETTKEQFANIVMNHKGILKLTATDSLLFSVRATKFGYDYQLDEVVEPVVSERIVQTVISGRILKNILLHSKVIEQEIVEYSYKVFVNKYLPQVSVI